MVPILAFRIQEKAYVGFDARVTVRLRKITDSLAPKSRIHAEARRRFKPGTSLVREWKGKAHEVTLADDRYEYQGKKYKSLSPSPAGSPAPIGQVPPSSEQRRKGSRSDLRTIPDSLRHLHP